MLNVYRKCEKSLDNLYGIEEIEDLESYDKPFLLCISAQDNNPKSVFGLIKEGARAARVRTSDELAGGFKIDEVPLDFLGIKYDFKNIKDKKHKSLLDNFIYPFLTKESNLKKQARKINFFTYCNATNVYVELEKGLKEKLKNDGYSEEYINEVISQISLVSIGSEIDISKVSATSVVIKDVNDREIYDKVSKICYKKMERLNRNSIVERISDNVLAYAYNGTGEHSLEEYFKDVCMCKSPLCACVSFLVENSIKNNESNELISIDQKQLLKRLVRYNGEFEDIDKLLDKIDDNIDYGSVSKYKKEEHEILCKLDKAYKKLAATKRFLDTEQKELENERRNNGILIRGIKENCSDVAFAQIVSKNGMWKNDGHYFEKLYNLKSDREVREEYDKMMTYQDENVRKL